VNVTNARWFLIVTLSLILPSCSVRRMAINRIGDAIASGGSTYERDEDLELVQGALPFGLKLIESMLTEAPKHKGLLLAAAQGFTSYAYVTVQQDLDRAAAVDFDAAEKLRGRARRLYLRGHDYGLRGLDTAHPAFSERLKTAPGDAVKVLQAKDLPLVYWTAASLGLAISSSRDSVSLIARIPEVEALLSRGLVLDEKWRDGALHEFAIVMAAAKPGSVDYEVIGSHYRRAVELSKGASAGVHVTYAESVAVPRQQRKDFLELLQRALAINPEEHEDLRLMNELAQRRARWLLSRIDDLILDPGPALTVHKEEQ
jgi:predicted anti-sigma-YlaC factor YlaD